MLTTVVFSQCSTKGHLSTPCLLSANSWRGSQSVSLVSRRAISLTYIYLTYFFSPILKCITNDYHMSTGLQYVWEYRSPSKSVPPHYHCKLCAVSRLQHDMLAHVKGWKHCFRYMASIVVFLVCLPQRHYTANLFVIFVYIAALHTAKSPPWQGHPWRGRGDQRPCCKKVD